MFSSGALRRQFLVHTAAGLAAVTLSVVVSACSDEHDDGHGEHHGEQVGVATGASCPPNSTLTWDSFGRSFMTSYCTRCHSSQLTGPARQSAPLGHDFDTENGVIVVAEHVDGLAAAGPQAVNTAMPPSNPMPTEAERRQLGEWVACLIEQFR
jgi:uncharacterized membrane protein